MAITSVHQRFRYITCCSGTLKKTGGTIGSGRTDGDVNPESSSVSLSRK